MTNKTIGVALLVVGAILAFYGISASESFASEVSEAVTGSPTDKAVWFLVGGAALGVVGLIMLLRPGRNVHV